MALAGKGRDTRVYFFAKIIVNCRKQSGTIGNRQVVSELERVATRRLFLKPASQSVTCACELTESQAEFSTVIGEFDRTLRSSHARVCGELQVNRRLSRELVVSDGSALSDGPQSASAVRAVCCVVDTRD